VASFQKMAFFRLLFCTEDMKWLSLSYNKCSISLFLYIFWKVLQKFI
jgi:hypothetical protein